MDPYIVSARKYRPATFDSVIGQKALTSTLKNAIATKRLAHAYLFCGGRGVGKTSCARIFAKTINCEHRTPSGEACNECESCRQFNEGRSFNIIELDAASHNGIDDMKSLIDQVMVPPTTGSYRVFIIDEVHMLSSSAFNAFLKTLEEPPSYVIFILATTEKHKIIPTILSRCQIHDFNRITISDMVKHMGYVATSEGISAEPAALQVIAEKADGAMRDALSIFDQVAASSMGNITYASTIENLNVLDHTYYSRLMDAFIKGNVAEALLVYKEVRDKGFDSQFFINGLASYVRDMMVARDPITLPLLDAPEEVKAEMASRAEKCTPDFFYRAMAILGDADLNFRLASNKQFHVELALIRLCQLLCPSPLNSGDGEGQLKAITPATVTAPTTTQASAPTHTPPTKASAGHTAPQPASDRTPVSEPHPSAVQTPAQPRRTSLRTPGISIKTGTRQTDNAVATTDPDSNRNAPYTAEDLLSGWHKFMEDNPKEHVLVNSMRAHLPSHAGDDLWAVVVESETQANIITEQLPLLHSYLRNMLKNDNITIRVDVNHGESAPVVWNEREVFQHMLSESDKMKHFVDKLKLSLL